MIDFGTMNGLVPTDGSSTTDTTPTFSWNAVEGAAGYEVQIAGSEAGLASAQAVEVSAASYTPSTALTNNQTHYWRVRAKDGDGQHGAWSAINSLSLNWGAVSGLSPANGSATTDTTPTFSWNTVEGAAGYELQIAESRAGVETAPATSVTGTSYTPTSALTNLQTHYWRVRAKDGDGQSGAWSAINSLSVHWWGTVSGLSPSDGSTTTDTTPALSWNAVPGAAGYEVQIADSEAGLASAQSVEAGGTSYTPTTALTNNTTHHWRVRAKDGDGQYGTWSAVQSLAVNIGAVSGLSPSSTTDTTPALSWNAVPGAAGYEVQIAGSEAGLASAQAVEVSAASYTPTTALTNLQTHYWRVRAKDGDGQHGAWSAINSLSLNWGAVSGLSPANGSATTDTTPTFSWNTVEGAAGYELQIAGSRAGVETAPATSVTGTSYTPTSALTNLQTHYWRVRAKDGDGQSGAWSAINSLSVHWWGTVSGLSPSSTTDTTPALSWNAVPGAAGYEVQIADSEGGVANSVAIDVTDASYTPATALTNLQTHYWRVRAKDGDGQHGAWSAINSLSVNWGTVSGLSPSSTTDTTPALSWNAVPGAAGYEVQIADSEGGVANSVAIDVTDASYTPATALTNLQTHYWRVRAKDGDGQHGAWSAINSLSVNWGTVTGLSPANGSATTDTTPTFSWNTVEGAAGYELQIAESRAGVETAPATSVTGTSYTPTSALTNLQTHYWRVRAKDGDGQAGSWSAEHSLNVVDDGFVYVEGGTFQMGSTAGDSDEEPVHQVTVSTFYMSRYEVTQKEWREVMGSSPSRFSGDNLPVEQVSWYDAVEYCNVLSVQKGLTPVYTINGTSVTANWSANGYRLPTEAEWEYAARGGNASNGYLYAGSDNADEVAWYRDNSGDATHPVGGKAPNELGLYDMSGNVWEWCWDWKGSYSSGNQSDPRGPASGSVRVNRGGSWYNSARNLRSANRYGYSPGDSNYSLGFRLVRREF